MATNPTTNPIPSELPRDLKFNAGKIDEIVNSPEEAYRDRFGSARLTWRGIENISRDSLLSYGFILVDSFETGATITTPNQALHYEANGEYFRWAGTLPKLVPPGSTPDSAGGISNSGWVSVGDASLRSSLAQSGVASGASLIGYLSSAGGAVPSTLDEFADQYITPFTFGAIGDGTLHPLSERFSSLGEAQSVYPHATSLTQSVDWAALQSAINYSSSAKLPVRLNAKYYVNSTLNISIYGAKLFGDRAWSEGVSIAMPANANYVLFNITATCSLAGFKILGPSSGTISSNILIHVTNTNAVRLDNLFFENGYRQLLLRDTSFYISINNCDFYGSYYSAIETVSATYPGVDLIMSHVRFLAARGAYVICFNGLGSAIISDVQASVNKVTQATLYFGTPAGGYGGCQMTNCVWENDGDISATAIAAVYINGSSSAKWKSIWFDNCIITGNAVPAVNMFWCNGAKFSNCGLSSTASAGVIYYNNSGETNDISFTNCEWSTSGSNPPIRFGAVVKGDVTLTGCSYIGNNAFVDAASAGYPNIKHINVINCFLGTGSAPITKTSDGYWPNGQVLTTGHQLGGFTKVVVTFNTDGSGSGTALHYVNNGQRRVALATACFKGGSGEAVIIDQSKLRVDGGSVYSVGGPASSRVRATVLFNEAEDAGW